MFHQGESIKKAQHAAAAIALEKTAYTHPPPKPQRPMDGAHDDKTGRLNLNRITSMLKKKIYKVLS